MQVTFKMSTMLSLRELPAREIQVAHGLWYSSLTNRKIFTEFSLIHIKLNKRCKLGGKTGFTVFDMFTFILVYLIACILPLRPCRRNFRQCKK